MKKDIYQSPYVEVVKVVTERLLTVPSETEQDHDADAKGNDFFSDDFFSDDEDNSGLGPKNLWDE